MAINIHIRFLIKYQFLKKLKLSVQFTENLNKLFMHTYEVKAVLNVLVKDEGIQQKTLLETHRKNLVINLTTLKPFIQIEGKKFV